MDAAPPSTETALDADVLCWRCRYNLRTRLPSQRCPECDASIAESIEHRREWGSLLYRPAWAGNALLVMAAISCLELALGATGLLMPELFELAGVYIAGCAIWFLSLLGMTAAVIWFVMAMRPNSRDGPGAPWRVLVIVFRVLLTCLNLFAIACDLYLFYCASTRTIGPSIRWAYAAETLIHIPALLVDFAIAAIALPYVLRVCRALRNEWLRRWAVIVFVVETAWMPVIMVDCILRGTALLTASMGVWRTLMAFHQVVIGVSILLEVGVDAYFVALGLRLRKMAGG